VSEPNARERAIEHVAELVLGAPPGLTREEVASAAGTTVERARTYWRAMGFPDVGDDPAFTADDAEALALLVGWVDEGVLDEATTIEVVRSLGQTTSRLADWQAGTVARVLASAEEPIDLADVSEGFSEMLPGLESLLVHAWRRHLAAVIGRALPPVEEPDAPASPASTATVGFADIAGFTRLARVLGEDELGAIVESFETGAADLVAGHGGRVVKTLGDEVMYVAPSADAGVAIAVAMHDLPGPDGERLRLRIGLATGRLVTLMGDYYGQTVNLASRLTAVARPGGTLMDGATEEALTDTTELSLRRVRPRALRGLGLVRTTAVASRRS
jgi:adenylate cyclase